MLAPRRYLDPTQTFSRAERLGELDRPVPWSCPCCGGSALARFARKGPVVVMCLDERCGFAGQDQRHAS